MAKDKTVYVCDNCGQESPKWIGKCPSCGAWNSFKEFVVRKDTAVTAGGWTAGQPSGSVLPVRSRPLPVGAIEAADEPRIDMRDAELNRVLGGGLVPGSLILLGGEPGIGKSTLVLQTVLRLTDKRVLYVSGEESARQLRLRADRLIRYSGERMKSDFSNSLENTSCLVVCETVLEQIFVHIKNERPQLVIIDSIQTMTTCEIESSAGSISQIRESASLLSVYAKQSGIPIVIVGHITKDGSIAGPKILEHMVDTVLQFEGDRNYGYRILRSIKNRFGSTHEMGIYEMQSYGLRQVSNPSEILLSGRDQMLSGTSVAATMEGSRPMFIETQALVATSYYPSAQKSSTGFDLRRLSMLLAVLEKRAGIKISNKDVFLNIAGGIKVSDPAIDLSVIVSLISSGEDVTINPRHCFAAEVGLSGELRPVVKIEQRIAEADKLGFERIYVSKYNLKRGDLSRYNMEIVPVSKIEDIVNYILR